MCIPMLATFTFGSGASGAAEGAAVIVVSSDLEEVAAVCDRALVIDRGRVAGEVAGAALTMDALIARSSLGDSRAARGPAQPNNLDNV